MVMMEYIQDEVVIDSIKCRGQIKQSQKHALFIISGL